jgi:hypothetical protein
MKLKQLLAKATVAKSELVKRGVEWSHAVEETGEKITEKFDVFIVKNISFAAHDRILVGGAETHGASGRARAICERLRFGDEGTEKMTFDDAANLSPDLGWVNTTQN